MALSRCHEAAAVAPDEATQLDVTALQNGDTIAVAIGGQPVSRNVSAATAAGPAVEATRGHVSSDVAAASNSASTIHDGRCADATQQDASDEGGEAGEELLPATTAEVRDTQEAVATALPESAPAPVAETAPVQPRMAASCDAEPAKESAASALVPLPAQAVGLENQPLPKGQATCELCYFCFKVLRAHLESQPPPPFPSAADPSFRAPLFVTWLKRRRSDRGLNSDLELRGCIGCLEPVVLRPGLSEYALRSSMQDKRFAPVKIDEVSSLTCKLSILFQFETCSDAHDWEVGLHGVLIHFADAQGRQYSATYLPEVPMEHGMSRETAIRELVSKSGYNGPCDQDLLKGIEVTRYKTLVESVAYWDYLRVAGTGDGSALEFAE